MDWLYLTVAVDPVPQFGRMSQYTDIYWVEFMLFHLQAVTERLEFIDGRVTYRVNYHDAGVIPKDGLGYYIKIPKERILRFSTTEETAGVQPKTDRHGWIPVGVPPPPRRVQ